MNPTTQARRDPIARMFSSLYINRRSVDDTEHYEISIIKTTASASQTDLKKIRC